MKMPKFNKMIVLFLATMMASACGVSTTKDKSSSSLEKNSSSQQSSVSNNKTYSSNRTSSSKTSSSNRTSSSNGSMSSSRSSSSSSASQSQTTGGYQILDKNYVLKSNDTTCDNHVLKEEIVFPASIISTGVKRKVCRNCGGFQEEFYYDLDECVFEDKVFMYDGQERSIYIDGMIPYGLTVKYENNKQTEIGSHEATAKFYNEQDEVVLEKTATISVVENIGLPEIRVITETGQDPDYKEKENYTRMTASVRNARESKYNISNRAGGIRVRGNSTNQSSVNKRAWRLKFDDKISLLGLNKGPKGKNVFKSWVLLADNFDYSYFRNATAFTFGDTLFNYSNNYTSHFQHVNFYMNDEYRGVYLLAEQQQSNEGRMNIGEVEPDEITYPETGGYPGTNVGYIVEIDGLVSMGQTDEEYYFTTGDNNSSQGGNPWGGGGFPWGGGGNSGDQINGVTISDKGYVVKTDIFGDQQFPFIKKYINNVLKIFKNAVKGEKLQILDSNNDLIDSPYTTQYETLNAVMDIESIFKTYVLQEFCKNYDCGWGSFYLFVDFSPNSLHPRLTCGAPWDFDLGLGNKKSDGHHDPEGDFIVNTGGSGGFMGGGTEFNPWLYLLSQTNFFNDLIGRYYTVFNNSAAYEKAMQHINYESSAFATDFANEYAKWAGDSGRTSMGIRTEYKSHSEAVTYLTNWLQTRKNYLDGKLLIK